MLHPSEGWPSPIILLVAGGKIFDQHLMPHHPKKISFIESTSLQSKLPAYYMLFSWILKFLA
jgi:hypothetical protein